MKDATGRTINYLRVSITDRCNFRCGYCMPLAGVRKVRHADMLSFEELFEVVRLMASRLGFNKVRVTGGEPLVRRGAIPFMRSLGLIPAINDLSLTTNAYYLEPVAATLRAAGFERINISLDTLRRDRFKEITHVDGLDQVLLGIAAAREVGFSPIKLNIVSMDTTLDEVLDLIAFGIDRCLQVRFIELMPVLGGAHLKFVSNDRIKAIVESRYGLSPIGIDGDVRAADPHGAAEVYRIEGTGATCGFISSISRPFCRACNRIRLRGDGRLKPCLASSVSFDLIRFIRPKFDPHGLEEYLRGIIRSKKASFGEYEIDTMSAFGG
ncbi:MAG: GTP 3',8-cyclase MoaA [Candidatus Eisenbacteria sp.]|nr:GTP 3',8-cyclase MoaA [Candidatus Eisenbacteria bacterium]